MHRLTIFVYTYLVCLLIPVQVFAITDSFTVQTLVGNDVAAPTVPANLTATAVATDQIDLDWDASSDNVAVTGYQVFRDTVQIATTTLTSYSDTGLASSTVYTYYVVAFDAQFNFSASSATASAETLEDTPVVTEEQGGGGGSYFPSDITTDVTYSAGERYIDIGFTSDAYVRSVIRWGRTRDYEGGYISTNAFKRSYSTRIEGLLPGTVYEVEIVLTDRSKRNSKRYTYTIQTKEGPDTVPPPNVQNLTAKRAGDSVLVSWDNPAVADFSHVRVMSGDYFYPTHPADGWLVYEGDAEEVLDERSFRSKEANRYYTVFTYDSLGNVSSGAVVALQAIDLSTFTDTLDLVATSGMSFGFEDIVFVQNDIRALARDRVVVLNSSDVTNVSFPYTLLPEHLKTIIVTLEHPYDDDTTFSFLLRVNATKDSYDAAIAPLVTEGDYPTSISVFDFKTRQLETATGTIRVHATEVIRERLSDGSVARGFNFTTIFSVAVMSFLIFLILLWLIVFRRRREDSDL